MIRRFSVSIAAALLAVVGFGASPASAVTLPSGDGVVECGVAGAVRVMRPLATPDTWKISARATIGGCTYNGTPIPFAVSGTVSTLVKASPAAVCAALADGAASATTRLIVKVNGTSYVNASIPVSIDVSPSAPGSLVSVGGSGMINGVTLAASVTAQTDRPVSDLCNGAAKVAFLGTASLSWDRP